MQWRMHQNSIWMRLKAQKRCATDTNKKTPRQQWIATTDSVWMQLKAQKRQAIVRKQEDFQAAVGAPADLLWKQLKTQNRQAIEMNKKTSRQQWMWQQIHSECNSRHWKDEQ